MVECNLKQVGPSKRRSGALQSDCRNKEPRERKVRKRPANLAGEEPHTVTFGNKNEAQRPADYAQAHAEAQPSQQIDCPQELPGVKN